MIALHVNTDDGEWMVSLLVLLFTETLFSFDSVFLLLELISEEQVEWCFGGHSG